MHLFWFAKYDGGSVCSLPVRAKCLQNRKYFVLRECCCCWPVHGTWRKGQFFQIYYLYEVKMWLCHKCSKPVYFGKCILIVGWSGCHLKVLLPNCSNLNLTCLPMNMYIRDVFTWGRGGGVVFSHYMVMLTFRLCYLHNEIAHMISGV